MDEYLATLGIVVTVEPLGPANLARATQLLNKTNQMNLTTRRLTEASSSTGRARRDTGRSCSASPIASTTTA